MLAGAGARRCLSLLLGPGGASSGYRRAVGNCRTQRAWSSARTETGVGMGHTGYREL